MIVVRNRVITKVPERRQDSVPTAIWKQARPQLGATRGGHHAEARQLLFPSIGDYESIASGLEDT